MQRRTLLQWMAALGSALRLRGQTAAFPGEHADTLSALAAVVLPSELGRERIAAVTRGFERWVREYRPAAEMDHGYGFTRLRSKPPSPAAAYLRQLDALRPALAAADPSSRPKAVETALEDAKIADLPRTPDGRHIAADLMAFYFRGSDANDLCYRAAIGRDSCRGLPGSDQPPRELK